MRIKQLFTVPEGEKVTEKHMMRVLLSSICGMLLCMVCLVSVTWAWFTVDMENTDNVIHIASVTANVQLPGATQEQNGGYTLTPGTYTATLSAQCDATECLHGSHYILITAVQGETTQSRFIPVPNGGSAQVTFTVTGGNAQVSMGVSWLEPAGAQPVEDGKLLLEAVQSTQETETTAATEAAVTE